VRTIVQSLDFAAFTLGEYARSGRILIETLVTVACLLLFFRSDGNPPPPEYFFSIAGVFTLALTLYSGSALLSLGDRAHGYLPISHGLQRPAYLLGLFLSVVAIVAAAYGGLSLAVAIINPAQGLDVRGWLLGTLPLMLNVTLLAALMTLMTPIVLSAGWRLAALALVALAFSGNLIGGPTLASLPAPLATALDVVRTVFSAPLLPAFTGFALAVSRDYSGLSIVVPLAQLFLTLGVLGLAISVFTRRELVLGA
jgi:hypothetical protein